MSVQNKSVRILLVGDDGVGKTSLILALVTEEFPDEVPGRAEEITIPADVTPEKVPTHIVDFSQSEQTEIELRDELERADVVCVVYAINDEESIQRITTYWLPFILNVLGEKRKPVVLVGNKADLMPIQEEKMESIVEIMDEFPEVETCIECSAASLKNISELFYYAQKAVLHPSGPLFSNEDQTLSEKCKRALSRIFKICDLDNDDLLNDTELNEFQKRCFKNSLPSHGIEEVKNIVRMNADGGLTDGGITLDGFLFLHNLFIQKGRQETSWTALRRFGYDNDLELRSEYLHPSLHVEPNCTVELSSSGDDFVLELFYKYDQDEDDALSTEELQSMEQICTRPPFTAEMMTATCRTEQNWMTADGFYAQWILWTYVSPRWTLEQLAHFGFIHGDMENQLTGLRVTRSKTVDQMKRKTTRSVFMVFVVGEAKAGKTAFLQSFVNNYIKNESGKDASFDSGHDSPESATVASSSESIVVEPQSLLETKISKYSCNGVQLNKKEVHLILEEMSVDEALTTNRMSECDVLCFLTDVTDETSHRRLQDVIEIKPEETPFICISAKADLRKRQQVIEKSLTDLVALHSQYPLQSFSAVEQATVDRSIFTKIASLATRAYIGTYNSGGSFSKYLFGASLTVGLLAAGGFLLFKYLKKGSANTVSVT